MKALIISNITKKIQAGHYSMLNPLNDLGYDISWAANFNDYVDDIKKTPFKSIQIDFHRNPFNPRNIIAFFQLMKILRNEKFDLIHCNSPVGGLLGRVCGKLSGVEKIIYTAHGFHFYKGAPIINITLYKSVERMLGYFTDALITINSEDYESAKKFRLRRNDSVFYVPGVGIDTKFIRDTNPNRKEILDELDLNDNSILLISVGELNSNKNNRVIIEALGELKNPNLHYLLCGVGEKENELLNLSKALNLQDNIHFLGYRNDISQLLKSCDIFVMPSFREGLSRSIMEAMSAGLPCVVSEIRGNSDLITKNKGGYLCLPNNVQSFSKAINELVLNEKIRLSMQKFNLEQSLKYDYKNIQNEFKLIYKSLSN